MTVIGFDNWDDMAKFLGAAEGQANERVVPEQREISYGSLWLRFYPLGPNDRTVIFGKVHTLEEIAAKEAELGAGPGEVQAVLAHTKDMNTRGYLFGTCWSTIEPTGELGNTHRSEIWYCPPALFEHAEQCGWDIDSFEPWAKQALDAVYQQWRRRASW